MHILQEIFRFSWLRAIIAFIVSLFRPATVPALPPVRVDPVEEFCANAMERFMRTYSSYSREEMNANVSPVFYELAKYRGAVEVTGNELEKEWRRRQTIVTTPRGNVVMYYDAYKLGFAYYSDEFIPYNVLNAVAMKYVIMYRCRDFFVDENVVPEEEKSRVLALIRDDKPTSVAAPVSVNAPFAKFKKAEGKKEEVKMYNRFISLGKMRNYDIQQKPPKKNAANGFHSNLIPKQVFTYKEYAETRRLLEETTTE